MTKYPLLVIAFLVFILLPQQSQGQSVDSAGYSAARDFSAAQNPSGGWSYGYQTSSGSLFTPYPNNNNVFGLESGLHTWYVPNPYNYPMVIHNGTGTTKTYYGITHPPDLLNLYPGVNGEKSVVRWTAPSAGTATIEGRFEGIHTTSTEVTITHNSFPLFAGTINGFGSRTPFTLTRTVAAGDTIEFAVGASGDFNTDSTGLSATVTLRPPDVDHSLSLNGAGAYVEVPNSATLNLTGPVTVEAWIKTDNSALTQGIIERYGATDGGYVLRLQWGKLLFGVTRNGPADSDFVLGGTPITSGVWHHVVGIYDGTQYRVYLDGKLDGSKAAGVPIGAGTSSLKIGAKGDDATYTFAGLIDEVRITAGVLYAPNFTPQNHLTTAVVLEDADGASVRGVWKFDGETTNDSSLNENHGTLVGGASFSQYNCAGVKYENRMEGTAAEPKVIINFDNLASGTIVTNQYNTYARFESFPAGNVMLTYSQITRYGTTLPYIAGWNGFQTNAHAHLGMYFTKPVNNLKFNLLGNDYNGCGIALIDIFQNGTYTTTLRMCGDGRVRALPVEFLSSYKNITAIVIYYILDPAGLGYDDFEFTLPAPPATPTPTPSPTPSPTPQVKSLTYEPVLSLIDDNTNPGGGSRIFPDKSSPQESAADTALRAKVSVRANTSYPPNTTIHFKSFDLDDPSTDSIIDVNGLIGNDNRGNRGTPQSAGILSPSAGSGTINTISAVTDANGIARVDLTVTKHPGDNFMVAASADQTYLNGIVVNEIGLRDAAGTALPTLKAKNTGMLTVWRKLHIEADSMTIVTNNHISGKVINTYIDGEVSHCGPNGSSLCMKERQRVCVDQTLTEPLFADGSPLRSQNRFQGGQLIINSVRYNVEYNGGELACKNFVDLGETQRVNVPAGTAFTLYDDDDWNNNDGSIFDGDESFEDIEPLPDITYKFIQSSGDPSKNVFAPAYIMPVIDGGGNPNNNQSNVKFLLNLEPGPDAFQAQVQSRMGSAGNESSDFWVVYIQLGYQPSVDFDNDPNVEGARGGITPFPGNEEDSFTDSVSGPNVPIGAQASMAFLETMRDKDKVDGFDWMIRTVPHEIGHQMALRGDDRDSLLGLMAPSGALAFVPAHINVLRWRVKSPGQ